MRAAVLGREAAAGAAAGAAVLPTACLGRGAEALGAAAFAAASLAAFSFSRRSASSFFLRSKTARSVRARDTAAGSHAQPTHTSYMKRWQSQSLLEQARWVQPGSIRWPHRSQLRLCPPCHLSASSPLPHMQSTAAGGCVGGQSVLRALGPGEFKPVYRCRSRGGGPASAERASGVARRELRCELS